MERNRVTGYAVILVLVAVVGLVITSIARDLVKKEEPVAVAEPAAIEEDNQEETEEPVAQKPRKQSQPTVWEGAM